MLMGAIYIPFVVLSHLLFLLHNLFVYFVFYFTDLLSSPLKNSLILIDTHSKKINQPLWQPSSLYLNELASWSPVIASIHKKLLNIAYK